MLPELCCLLTMLSPAQDGERASLSADISKLPAPTAEQTLALETLNGFRALHGLAPVTMDLRLNASAALHASNMSKKRVLTHKDNKEEAATATQRAQKFGYDKAVAELVASGMPDSPYAVVTFIDAPYHRRLLLKPGTFQFGCATQGGYTCFVLGGTLEPGLVLSPPQGAQGVPVMWDGREEPNPMRGTGLKAPYGYPVLLAATGSTDLKVIKATITDPNNVEIAAVLKQPSNDTEIRDCAILVPKKPLTPKTDYKVLMEFQANGETKTQSWTFRTGDQPK